MNDFDDDIHNMRQTVTRGQILAIDDTGPVQTATVKTADGVIRAGVEVIQLYGLASYPPAGGGEMVLLANGNDAADLIGFVTAPSYRFGKQNHGETALYSANGCRIQVQQGGILALSAGARILLDAPEVDVTGNLTINGDVTINGDLIATGNVTVDGNINATGTIHGA